jgi:hypothetical protein
MIQIRPGDFIAVTDGESAVLFAILTKQILFGGHWSYVFHEPRPTSALSDVQPVGSGFNAAVDFIHPKREHRLVRISRGHDYSALMGPELLQQEPAKGEESFSIWRWKHGKREDADWIRYTTTPTAEERSAPRYSAMPAELACTLAVRRWEPHISMRVALRD